MSRVWPRGACLLALWPQMENTNRNPSERFAREPTQGRRFFTRAFLSLYAALWPPPPLRVSVPSRKLFAALSSSYPNTFQPKIRTSRSYRGLGAYFVALPDIYWIGDNERSYFSIFLFFFFFFFFVSFTQLLLALVITIKTRYTCFRVHCPFLKAATWFKCDCDRKLSNRPFTVNQNCCLKNR